MATQHTPTPWRVNDNPQNYGDSVETVADEKTILEVRWFGMRPTPEAEANAAFIVLACNAYERDQAAIAALLEAARTADQWLADTGVIGVGHPVRKQLRAAITAAEGRNA